LKLTAFCDAEGVLQRKSRRGQQSHVGGGELGGGVGGLRGISKAEGRERATQPEKACHPALTQQTQQKPKRKRHPRERAGMTLRPDEKGDLHKSMRREKE